MERTNYFYARRALLAIGFITTVIWGVVTWLTIETNPYRVITCVSFSGDSACLWPEPFKPAYLSWLWPLVLSIITYLSVPRRGTVMNRDDAYVDYMSYVLLALLVGAFAGLAILTTDPGLDQIRPKKEDLRFVFGSLVMFSMIAAAVGVVGLYVSFRAEEKAPRDKMRITFVISIFVASLLAGFRGWQTGVSVFLAFMSGGLIAFCLCAVVRRFFFPPRKLE